MFESRGFPVGPPGRLAWVLEFLRVGFGPVPAPRRVPRARHACPALPTPGGAQAYLVISVKPQGDGSYVAPAPHVLRHAWHVWSKEQERLRAQDPGPMAAEVCRVLTGMRLPARVMQVTQDGLFFLEAALPQQQVGRAAAIGGLARAQGWAVPAGEAAARRVGVAGRAGARAAGPAR